MISIFKNQFDASHTKQRFTIKKLSIGVVSVLVGFTFLGLNRQSASADVTLVTDTTMVDKESTSVPMIESVPATTENNNTLFNDSAHVIESGTKDATVLSLYPDGSTDEATIPVIVANKTQAETNNPIGKK